jgi:hypothetical protein
LFSNSSIASLAERRDQFAHHVALVVEGLQLVDVRPTRPDCGRLRRKAAAISSRSLPMPLAMHVSEDAVMQRQAAAASLRSARLFLIPLPTRQETVTQVCCGTRQSLVRGTFSARGLFGAQAEKSPLHSKGRQY